MQQEKPVERILCVGQALAMGFGAYCVNPGVFKSAREGRSAIRIIELWARSHDCKQQN